MERSWFSVYLASLCVLSLATQIYCDVPDIPSETPFSTRWPWVTGATIRDGFYHNGTFHLVGDEGTYMSSTDGNTWKVCSSPLNGNYPYASFTNQYYIHSDDHGTVAYSSLGDCRNMSFWSTTTQNFTVNLLDMQIAPELVPLDWDGGFVGVVDYKVYQSPTGNPGDWTRVDVVDVDSKFEAWGVAYADGKWGIKFGDATGTAPFRVHFSSSTDRLNWSPLVQTTFQANFDYSLSYCTGAKKWISVVTEGIITSSDLSHWDLARSFSNSYGIHTLSCIGDRCVGANRYQLFETLTCGTTWYDGISPQDLSDIGQGFPVASDQGVFIVAGEYGGVYRSSEDLSWVNVGAVEQDAKHLTGCDEAVPMKNKFILKCPKSSLVSDEGATSWKYYPYELNADDLNDVQLSNYAYGQGVLIAVGGVSEIFMSDDDDDLGKEWKDVATLKVSDKKPALLDSLRYDSGSDSFVGFGRVLWNLTSTGVETYVPAIVASPNGFGWKIFSPNYWISSAVYSPVHKKWIGAGQSGLFTADANYYTWVPVSAVQGVCSNVLANYNYTVFMAHCTNMGSNIYKVSTNLKDWTDYYSPCGLTTRPPNSQEICETLTYVHAWNRFVFFGPDPQGVSFTSTEGKEWSETIFPYSMSWLGITSIKNVILTLTKGVVLSGVDDWLAYFSPVTSFVYEGDLGPLPEPPELPVESGVLATINDSQFESSEDESEEDLNGGAIFGITLASLFAILLLLVLAGVIGLAIFVFIQLRKHPRERIYLLGEDENESL